MLATQPFKRSPASHVETRWAFRFPIVASGTLKGKPNGQKGNPLPHAAAALWQGLQNAKRKPIRVVRKLFFDSFTTLYLTSENDPMAE